VQEYIQNLLILTALMNMSLTYYITFLICLSHCDYKVTRSVKKKKIIAIRALDPPWRKVLIDLKKLILLDSHILHSSRS
jgi:hypothetical protein